MWPYAENGSMLAEPAGKIGTRPTEELQK